jgi:hypothetical protein
MELPGDFVLFILYVCVVLYFLEEAGTIGEDNTDEES